MPGPRSLALLAAMFASALASPTAAFAAPAPQLPVASFDQLPQPLPYWA